MTKVDKGFLTLFAVGACVIVAQMIIRNRQNHLERTCALQEKLPEKQAGNNKPIMYLVK